MIQQILPDNTVQIPFLFSPAQTLDCGQCFRWNPVNDKRTRWNGIAFGTPLNLEQTENGIHFCCSSDDFHNIWKSYFDLDFDYESVRQNFCEMSPILREAAEYAGGIRILRQDPWETLCSFIISQNNNIPRIKGIIDRFCQTLGTPQSNGEFSFPTAQALACSSPEELAPLRAGFRVKYLLSAGTLVAEGKVNLKQIAEMPIQDARETLMLIKGVGPKVAECALLYGFHRLEAFPMDVWMKRAMACLFPKAAPEDFGKYAGIAQQYIFHYSRMHPELFK